MLCHLMLVLDIQITIEKHISVSNIAYVDDIPHTVSKHLATF